MRQRNNQGSKIEDRESRINHSLSSILYPLFFLVSLCSVGCADPVPTLSPATSPDATPRTSSRLRYFDIINLDVRDVPLLMALDELAARGYVIEKTYLSSAALIADALARGDADIGLLNNQTMWIAITKGASVRTIAQFTASTSVLAAKREIKSCREIGGRRLAVATTRGLSPALFDVYLKQHCGSVAPQFLVILESAGRAAALLAGEVDATIMPGEELLKLQRESPGLFHSLMSYAQAFPKFQIDGLHVRRPWAEQNPEMVKDFLRALLKAHRLVAANPQLLFDESVKRLSLDAATAQAIGESHLRMGIWDGHGGLTPENIQYTLDFLTNIAVLPSGLQIEDVADLSYLNAVLNELGRQE
jgi:ABC-type nitrate/sulfonate/bicarbonate transport system substrate-binding protein